MIVKTIESIGRLEQYITRFLSKKNRAFISYENKYPVVIKHRELASSQPLIHIHNTNIDKLLESTMR